MARWLGVDVGGKRKGFDIAVIDDRRLLALAGGLDVDGVVAFVAAHQPALIGIDSPRRCAPDGRRARDDERMLAREVCGIRWTPDAAAVRSSAYFAWILCGLELFEAVSALTVEAIEVFPTASWTRWHGPRGQHTRAQWSRAGLAAMFLDGLPTRTNQDQRDAIAAAVTARQHSRGETESIGEIVVPAGAW
jgi:predicted nuclease with RNAse H fold